MKKFLSLLPIVVLLALSYYAYQNYQHIPQSTANGLIFLPHILALFTFAAAIHFNRSSIFFYCLIIVGTYFSLKLGITEESINASLITSLSAILIVCYTLLPERGIFTTNAYGSYLALSIAVAFAFFVATQAPVWETFLLQNYLPEKYFDWTTLSQSSLLVIVIAIISMLIIVAVAPSPHTAAGLGVVILLSTQNHLGAQQESLIILSSSALLMCLYAIIQESWRMAYLDELTGLPGRRALREKFQQLNGTYSIAMLDVDHFKKFNDTYGHDVGDSVLRMIASQISKVSGSGIAYRYGGEEFSVVFANKDSAEAKEYLEQVRENIATHDFVVNRENRRGTSNVIKTKKKKIVKITISIGLADSTEKRNKTPGNPWDVLKLADKALYRAKKKGRNCISV